MRRTPGSTKPSGKAPNNETGMQRSSSERISDIGIRALCYSLVGPIPILSAWLRRGIAGWVEDCLHNYPRKRKPMTRSLARQLHSPGLFYVLRLALEEFHHPVMHLSFGGRLRPW